MNFDCHRDPHAQAVLIKFPTATAVQEATDSGVGPQWWVNDNTGAILSEVMDDGLNQVFFPTEQDAWDSAYLTSVLGKTKHDIQVEAYKLWELTGRPDGTDVENWLDAKGDLENPAPVSPPPPIE